MSRRKRNGKRFAMVPTDLIEHVSVVTLKHSARWLLVLLAAEYRGKNNGAIGITPKQAAERGIRSEVTFYEALNELQSRGLIEQTRPGSRVPPRPAMFALSWLAIDDTAFSIGTRTPSYAYRDWAPTKKKSDPQNLKLRPPKNVVKEASSRSIPSKNEAMDEGMRVP